MSSTVGQFIIKDKLERIIKYNSENPAMIPQLTHVYLVLKEGLQGDNIKMKPMKGKIKLSVPHLGKLDVVIHHQDNREFYLKQFNFLKEENVNPQYKTKTLTPDTFLHYKGDLYLYPEIGTQKALGLPKHTHKIAVYNEDYILSQVKSAIDFFQQKKSLREYWK